MTYFNFINKTKKYLKSVRVIKDYVSFDMCFSSTWVIQKEYYDKVEIIKNKSDDNDKIILSFGSAFVEEEIIKIEDVVDSIIKYNIEKEEKEQLFRNKVKELKSIFESNKLDNLKSLKFDVDYINEIINEEEKVDDGPEDTEGDRELQSTEEEKSL
jgi:hypothetical protein